MNKVHIDGLDRTKITCPDCEHCGVFYDPDPVHCVEPLKKACPRDYLWNHPDPLSCPNFRYKRPPECPFCHKRFDYWVDFRDHKCKKRPLTGGRRR